jgi:hypothetical protein
MAASRQCLVMAVGLALVGVQRALPVAPAESDFATSSLTTMRAHLQLLPSPCGAAEVHPIANHVASLQEHARISSNEMSASYILEEGRFVESFIDGRVS